MGFHCNRTAPGYMLFDNVPSPESFFDDELRDGFSDFPAGNGHGGVEKPTPQNNEVCIKIFATTVTASDCIVRGFKLPRWHPMGLAMGLAIGFGKPRQPILGMMFAGEIESAGKDVARFKAGDQVYGSTFAANQIRFGAYAEYICLPENSLIALKPSSITYEEAAAVPYGAGIAFHYLRK